MIVALQYWTEDEPQALALARFLADIETSPRGSVVLALCRRKDCAFSEEAKRTQAHCEKKLPVLVLQSQRPEVGHPDGCFGLWAGTVDNLHRLWMRGILEWELGRYVFTCEADGGPIRRDWASRLRKAHARTLALGKHVTGAVMDEPEPHVNGNLVIDLSMWDDHPGLSSCPAGTLWDIHHAGILLSETRPSLAIRNDYGATDLAHGYLAAVARETAWVHGCRDDSVINYGRRVLLG
jgi:hypothetical protein